MLRRSVPVVQLLPAGLLPDHLAKRAFIAGGYAACPDLAADIDVWVDAGDRMTEVRQELLAHLADRRWAITPQDGTDSRRLDGEDYDGDLEVDIRKVCVIPWNPPIHLMVTNRGLKAVLAAFDISTHQVGIDPWGVRQEGREFTPLTESPEVLRHTSTTAARLEKIRTRYAHLRKAALVAQS